MNNKLKIKAKSFSLQDQIFFSQRLSLLLNSGISIVEALNIMKNIESLIARKIIYSLFIKNIEEGISLGKSIKNNSIRFDSLLIMLIENGEASGYLSEALLRAENYLEKRNDMRKRIINSLFYPGFIILATIFMTLFLILYIFPKITPLLSSLNIPLPLITRIVQNLYYFLVGYGLWFLIAMISFFVGMRFLIKKIHFLQYQFHKSIIFIPFLKNQIRVNRMILLCNVGEMLLNSGKSLPDVLFFFNQSSRNLVYKQIFVKLHEESLRGVRFSISITKYYKYFPPILINMCALGERTGNFSLMLGYCSKIFEQDTEMSLKRFTSLIEPVLMVLMGLIVGSIALSIILPVYEITNHLS